MDWLEVRVTADNEAAEAIAEVLSRHTSQGVAFETGPEGWGASPVTVRAFLPVDDRLPAKKRQVEEAIWHLSQIRAISPPSFHPIAEKDWTEAWKKHLQVVHIGRRFVIRPSWLDYSPDPDEAIIELDPGMAFGTGLHPTTQLCLQALEEHMVPSTHVLDMGTGSGILAIAAAKLGAAQVLALDTDPTAVKTARDNVARNQVQHAVTVRYGSLEDVREDYHLIVVNILAKTIIDMVQQGLGNRLSPDGVLITTGIIVDQEGQVTAALERHGLKLTDRQQIDDWVCLVARGDQLSV